MNPVWQVFYARQLLSVRRPRPAFERQARVAEWCQVNKLLIAPGFVRINDDAVVLRRVDGIRDHRAIDGPRCIVTAVRLGYLPQSGAIAIDDPELVVTGAPRSKRDALSIRRPARPGMAEVIGREIALVRTVSAHHVDVPLLAHRVSGQPMAIRRHIRKPQLQRALRY